MKKLFLIIFIIFLFPILNSCSEVDKISSVIKSNIEVPSKTVTEKKVLQKTTEVISNDLSNKGLICTYYGRRDKLSSFGFWFKDDKLFEKWFNENFIYRTDGFEFVRVERRPYTYYEVTDTFIYLHYSKKKGLKPYYSKEVVNRMDLSFSFEGKEIGDCKVVIGKDEFLNELKKISDHYREQHKNKLKDRKI